MGRDGVEKKEGRGHTELLTAEADKSDVVEAETETVVEGEFDMALIPTQITEII